MANLEFMNKKFVQDGNICALASYGIVIEYFSKGKMDCEHVLGNYFEKYNLYDKTTGVFYFKEKHKLIYEQFHEVCRRKKINGFTYISQLHDKNDLQTSDYCQIIDIQAPGTLIVEKDLFPIREILKDQDALLMVLYKSGEETINNVTNVFFHAIIIGYDNTQNKFFYKDPSIPMYQMEDIIFQKAIYEFIVFTKKPLKVKVL
jgi:hypothetical protein